MPRVMGIPLHPFHKGQALRTKYLAQALRHMKQHNRVGFATGWEIYETAPIAKPAWRKSRRETVIIGFSCHPLTRHEGGLVRIDGPLRGGAFACALEKSSQPLIV